MASTARAQRRMVPALVLLAVLINRVARADDLRPFEIGTKPVWYVLAGATTGDTLVARDGAYFLGGEVSIVRLSRAGRFLGLYGDGYYDFGSSRTNATAGIELGYRFVSVDGGGAFRLGGEHAEWGVTGRLCVGVGILTLYGRYEYFSNAVDIDNEHVVQVGVLVKIPLKVWGME
jgi:hypothetical protein